MYAVRKIWKPALFQGRGVKNRYFEGWYFKIVSPDRGRAFAVIPGVSRGEDSGDAHAFVQFLDGISGEARYFSYPVEEFQASKKDFSFSVGPNRFSADGMRLSVDRDGCRLSADVSFGRLTPWPVRLFSPGYMGWYAFAPFMECYHGILSFDHEVRGTLSVDDDVIVMDGGRGYMEKDWGRSFPRAWIWMQTNGFDRPGVSFSFSIATVPWRGHYFTGFGGALLVDGKLVPFTTYNGSRITRLSPGGKDVSFTVERAGYRLEVEAKGAAAGELKSPVTGSMKGRVLETIGAEIRLRLRVKTPAGEITGFEGTGVRAGLEIMGDMGELSAGL